MRHYLINPTWRCQNRCSYCWVVRSVRRRPELEGAPERSAADWIQAIHRDKPELVDIAGGEPLLYEGLLDIIWGCPETKFGLSTNALQSQIVLRLANESLENIVSINASYHPETSDRIREYPKTWRRNVRILKDTGYLVHSNVVLYGDNLKDAESTLFWLTHNGIHAMLSPYESVEDLRDGGERALCCEAGENHVTVAPDGTAWPCLTTLRSPQWHETILGNWLDGGLDLSKKPSPCYLRCHDYYVLYGSHEAGDMWNVRARPCEEDT